MKPNFGVTYISRIAANQKLLSNITIIGYAIVTLSAGIYIFWIFRHELNTLLNDEEFYILASIQILFPLIALLFYLFKYRVGWFLLQFFSIANVIYSLTFFIVEHYFDITDMSSMVHLILALVMLTRPQLERFNIARRHANHFSIIIAILLLAIFLIS